MVAVTELPIESEMIETANQQDDGGRDRIGHEPFYKPRKGIDPVFSQDACLSGFIFK